MFLVLSGIRNLGNAPFSLAEVSSLIGMTDTTLLIGEFKPENPRNNSHVGKYLNIIKNISSENI